MGDGGGGRREEVYVFHAAAHVFFVEGFYYEVAGVWVLLVAGRTIDVGTGC